MSHVTDSKNAAMRLVTDWANNNAPLDLVAAGLVAEAILLAGSEITLALDRIEAAIRDHTQTMRQ